MERRRDYRHRVRYRVSVQCKRTNRVLTGLACENVSASGVRVVSDAPHGFSVGDRTEVQIVAEYPSHEGGDALVMATQATIVRASRVTASFAFAAPLAY